MSIAPIIVEKIEKKARSLSAARRPGIKGSIRSLVHELGKDLATHLLVDPRQFGGKCCQRAAPLGDRSIPG